MLRYTLTFNPLLWVALACGLYGCGGGGGGASGAAASSPSVASSLAGSQVPVSSASSLVPASMSEASLASGPAQESSSVSVSSVAQESSSTPSSVRGSSLSSLASSEWMTSSEWIIVSSSSASSQAAQVSSSPAAESSQGLESSQGVESSQGDSSVGISSTSEQASSEASSTSVSSSEAASVETSSSSVESVVSSLSSVASSMASSSASVEYSSESVSSSSLSEASSASSYESAQSSSASSAVSEQGDPTRGAIYYYSYLVPPEQYPYTCASCHGVKGDIRRINPNKEGYGNYNRSLEEYITVEMPQIYTHLCVDQCARDVAAYIRTWRSGERTGVLFSDDFESTPIDTQPDGWENFVGWLANNSAGNTKEWGNFALVDESDAYRGRRAAHFKTHNGSPALLVRKLPEGLQRVHLRAYVKLNVPMGKMQSSDNHEHFMGLKRGIGEGNGDVGVGQVKGNIGTFYAPVDSYSNAASNVGIKELQADTWYCIEAGFYGDKYEPANRRGYGQLYLWVNGDMAHSITTMYDWATSSIGGNWLADKFNYAMFGFHGFSGRDAEVWMDDVVISVDRVGCD